MTTDVGETQAPPLEQEPPAESTSQALGTEQAPLSADTGELDVDALHASWLQEQGIESPPQTDAVQNGTQPETLTPEEVERRAQELAAQRLKEEQERYRAQSISVDYRNRAAWIRQAVNDLRAGRADWDGTVPGSNLTYADVFSAQFDAHHAQAERVLAPQWLGYFHGEAASLLPEADRKDFLTRRTNDKEAKDFFGDLQAALRKGFVSEPDAVKREKAAYAKGSLEFKAELQKKGILPGSKAPANDNGSNGATYGSMTLDQIENMPTAQWLAIPKERRDQLLAAARTRSR